MKISAVGVSSKDLSKTVEFYQILGFKFPEYKEDEQHLEAIREDDDDARFMIDTVELSRSLIGEEPRPSNHSVCAIEYEESKDIDKTVAEVRKAGFKVIKEPWDAFWGQRYAVVADPDGYMVDLFSELKD